ncbi:MAG TPA: type III polyketide synthase [Oscillatoriaceae cyanobacterium]
MTGRIVGVGTALPGNAMAQQTLYARHLVPYFGGNSRAEKIFANPAIATRHTVLADPGAFYAESPGAGARNAVFAREAPGLARRAAERALGGQPPDSLDALITVTCTGYMTPGLDILLAQALGMRPDLRRFGLGGMGCYAAFPGLNLARSALSAGARRALVVCAELCTLHFQPDANTDNIVSTSLFADGASAIALSGEDGPGWSIVDTRTATLYDTGEHMTWHLTDTGFRMSLSSYVPLILREAIGDWLAAWLAEHGLTIADVAHWGIHPGGPRILDHLQEALGLSEAQMTPSREVLRTCGNMSSATIFFILNRLAASPGERALLLAFGPGLTLEGALLEWREP